jgi:D-glycero-D-manno-heptose 1,7-bisphosphate phosphatase
VLVDLGTEALPTVAARRPSFVARDTVHALRLVRAVAFGDGAAERDYRPARWVHANESTALATGTLATGDR